MTEITLHFSPGTCARVPMTALEEIGQPFQTTLVALARGDQRTADYLALNPKGKVPLLIVDGQPLTENVAILSWLAARFPEAGLLPRPADAFEQARITADLAFCASLLHPIVTRLRMPHFFCDSPEALARVFEMACGAMRPHFDLIEKRLSADEWWYGDRWSILDVYLNWVWFRVSGTRADLTPYPSFARHNEALQRRPSVQRALQREAEAQTWLADRGLEVKFAPV